MSDKEWSGNVGEWGELYAACELLATGSLSIAERPAPYQVLELKRPEQHGLTSYTLGDLDVKNSFTGSSVPRSEYSRAATRLKHAIQNKTAGKRAFGVAKDLQVLLSTLGFTKISAGSAASSDLHIELRFPGELERFQLKGYSIKTEAGAAPTLYNMSSGRDLHYSVTAEPAALIALNEALVRGGRGRQGAMAAFAKTRPLIEPGTDAYPQIVGSEHFSSNLRSTDGDAPVLLAMAVLEYYFYGARRCSDAVSAVAHKNPLKNPNLGWYHVKYSKLWREFALGLPGIKEYAGYGADQGGILRVKADLSIEAVPATREGGGDLLSNTVFDAPSFKRWLTVKGLKALTMVDATHATLILPWQIRWISQKS
jgi:hypothetical protein